MSAHVNIQNVNVSTYLQALLKAGREAAAVSERTLSDRHAHGCARAGQQQGDRRPF